LRIAIPHPVTQITLWVYLAVLVQTLQTQVLPMLAVVLVFLAFKAHAKRLLTLLRRTRWILISLMVIYAFMTPGYALWSLPYIPNPTKEGLLDGMLQLSRLVCVLAGLSILLTSLSQERLISGLYVLAYPLRYIGVSRERIAVRLALTLEYSELAMQETAKDWRSGIDRALQPVNETTSEFELPLQMPTWTDGLLLILVSLILITVWR
jgi:energy-coupling factor transport system permease protein